MTASVNGSVRLKLWSGSGSVPTTVVEDLGTMTVGGASAFNYSRNSANKPVLAAIVAGPLKLGSGTMQLTFTSLPAVPFTILATTKIAMPLSNWTTPGTLSEAPPGQYQFTDLQATNFPCRFYLILAPDRAPARHQRSHMQAGQCVYYGLKDELTLKMCALVHEQLAD